MNHERVFTQPLFNLGFRVFFALAGLSALMLMLLWNAMFKGTLHLNNYFAANEWHGHEMLLGYTIAVIAGFLLTAVKNWTNQPTVTGDKLLGLALIWLYGRIVPFYAGLLPNELIALIDLAFLPTLAYQISIPILNAKNYRNLIFVALLLILTLANVFIHGGKLGWINHGVITGLKLSIATIILIIIVIAGRVIPFFTERGLTGVIIIKNPLFDHLAIGSSSMVFILELFNHTGHLLAIPATIATISHCIRLHSWYIRKIWYVPLLWVLYVGYAWIILGFFLLALSAYQFISASLSIHAFTVGGIGVLTLGMMARVSLGHTGRILKASNTIALAFVLINIAALLRVFFPMLLPAWYNTAIYLTSLIWLAAFALFVFVYVPILSTPRADGKEG